MITILRNKQKRKKKTQTQFDGFIFKEFTR